MSKSQTSMWRRYPMWKIAPGLLIYNLVGRHILAFHTRRLWLAKGLDPAMAPTCGWISFKEVKGTLNG